MKTPKKSSAPGDVSAPSTPSGRTYYKRFEILFVTLGAAIREDLVGSPDVGVLPVTVPGTSSLESSRLARHICEKAIVELVSAQKFNGVVIDSILDTGVDISREVFDAGPVVGTFLPSVSQALLIGGTFGVVVVNAEGDFVCQTLRELAVRYHVSDRLVAIHCVPASSLPSKEEEASQQLVEIVVSVAKKNGCSSVILSGGVHIPSINETLRLRGESLVVIDASLAAINAVEGLIRQGLRASRKLYPKSGSLKDFNNL